MQFSDVVSLVLQYAYMAVAFLQNRTPFEIIITAMTLIYLVFLWFLSDRFNNKVNAIAFTFTYIALSILLYIGFQLTTQSLENAKSDRNTIDTISPF